MSDEKRLDDDAIDQVRERVLAQARRRFARRWRRRFASMTDRQLTAMEMLTVIFPEPFDMAEFGRQIIMESAAELKENADRFGRSNRDWAAAAEYLGKMGELEAIEKINDEPAPDYFDELSEALEEHPPGMPGMRR